MSELLAEILEAHGGLECWNQFQKVEATIVNRRPIPEMLMVSIDISEVGFTRKD